jgi:UDP:flavonoid glycosyltransferase YjiC (YdhE family)
VPPVVALVEAAVEAGHEATVLSQPSVRARAERAGARFVGFSRLGDYAKGRALEEQLDLSLPAIAGREVGTDLVEVAATGRADVVIVDANLSGCLAAAETLPSVTAVLLHSMYRTFVDTWFAELWPLLEAGVNETRAAFGVEPVDSWPAAFARQDAVVSVVPRSFDAPVTEPPRQLVQHGFLVPRPVPSEAVAAFPQGDGPTVLVGLSTTYQAQEALLRSIVEALGGLTVRALVTTAGQVDGDALQPAANVAVTDFVAHGAVLPHTDVMVTHAGLGSVAAALSAGVPLVCTPIARDQPLNTARVEALGVGIGCGADAGRDEVAAAVTQVLDDPRHRERAVALAAESRKAGGAAAVVAALAERTPVR